MNAAEFEPMVARLERESETSPWAYKAKVALLALLGFGLLGLMLGVAGAGLLVLAGIAVALVATGGGALIVLLKLGKLLVLLALPLWFLVKSSLQALFVRLPAPTGLPVTRQQAPHLFNALDDMRRRMKGPRFHQVLLVDDMNAAVVQRPLFGLIGFPRNYLLLGLPLLESTSPNEALAVVAHEYGHLAGSHGRFGAFIYRLRLSWATIQAIVDQWTGLLSGLLRKPLRWYAPYFNAYTFVLARANEYEADAASAALVGREAAVSALKRVDVSGRDYARFLEATFKTMRTESTPPDDLSDRWARIAAEPLQVDRARQDLVQALGRDPGVADTHPSLRQRLKALGVPDHQLDEPPTPLATDSAAVSWLREHLPSVRNTFQAQWKDQVSRGWREQFQEWTELRNRLQALQAQDERTVTEEHEVLRLTVQLHPDENHLPAAAAFNEAHPDLAIGLYLEGMLRLEADDESGLALLDRAMVLDEEAIRPACERAYEFLSQRKDPRAQAYADRWQHRQNFEAERQRQLSTLDPAGAVVPADLSADERDALVEMLRKLRPGVAGAWVARRVVPAAPQARTFVVVLRPRWWTRWRNKGDQVLQAAVQGDDTVAGHFCLEVSPYKALCKRIQAQQGARLL